MNPLEQLQTRLEQHNLSLVHRESGVSYSIINALACGRAEDIYVSTQVRLNRAMDAIEGREGKPCN